VLKAYSNNRKLEWSTVFYNLWEAVSKRYGVETLYQDINSLEEEEDFTGFT